MRWVAMAAALAVILTGCADSTKARTTDFTPISSTEFQYRSLADSWQHKTDDPAEETTRLGYLQKYLADASMCPSGYDISDRKVVYKDTEMGIDFYDIHYRGRCH
jgi:hypothetical protein